jgi:hypothetical protein
VDVGRFAGLVESVPLNLESPEPALPNIEVIRPLSNQEQQKKHS